MSTWRALGNKFTYTFPSQSPPPRRHSLPNKSCFPLESGDVYTPTELLTHGCFLDSCSSSVNKQRACAAPSPRPELPHPLLSPRYLQPASQGASSRQAAGVLKQEEAALSAPCQRARPSHSLEWHLVLGSPGGQPLVPSCHTAQTPSPLPCR